MWRENGAALIEISDDGVGGADDHLGTGLRGLADRVAALDGSLQGRKSAGRRHGRDRRDAVRVVICRAP